MNRKIDVISDCYSQLRISGLTVNPSPEDLEVALMRLETMMAELKARNICTSYNNEEEPDPNSVTNVEPYARQMMATNLAVRLIPDFNKQVPMQLQALAGSSMATVSAVSAKKFLNEVQYPNRMPRGSGNTLRVNRWQRFYRSQPEAPKECATNDLYVGDIDDYSEPFSSWLNDGEALTSYTIDVGESLMLLADSQDGSNINYIIEAEKPFSTSSGFRRVKITVTSDAGRVESRIINFNIKE